MEEYRRIRERRAKAASATGIVLTMLFHSALAYFAVFNGLEYIYPPPEEKTFLIDFTEVTTQAEQATGRKPSAEEADPNKAQELVQRSEAALEGSKAGETKEAALDDFGDVESTVPKEDEIDKRSLFPSAASDADTDTLAAQTARKVTDALKAGHASGNTRSGRTNGEPNAQVKGRNTIGVIPKPAYIGQETGTVVVRVWVDQYGNVAKAQAGDDGTTVADATLWAAARKAAMETHFNMSTDAPALQEGTITYIFSLK